MEARTRIVHLIHSLESGGAENVLLRTLPLLNDDEFEHVVITLFRPGELSDEFERKRIKTINIGLKHMLDLRSFRELVNQIHVLAPGLVITYLFHADAIGRLYLRKRISTPVIPFLRTTYNFPRYLPARIFERATKGLVAHYFANSEAVKDYYVRNIGASPGKFTVIPNGIDLLVFDRADGDRVVRELQLPRERFVISCVANFAKNKGHALLIEAFDRLSQAHPEAWLVLVGTGEGLGNLQRQTRSYASQHKILFLGRRKDVPDILAASDSFVFPTLFEGMPNAVLEAMAAGLPIVTTDIPENRVLITDRVNGLLVEPAKAEAIQEALEDVFRDARLRSRIGKAARATVEQRFSMPRVLQMWGEALREFAKP